MAPIVKDVENSAATTAPSAPATKPPQDASATRPQPVALEVPVTVNGARTVEGSDKREPFSESTKTVLVFGHGAVVRLASLVMPGQLLFVTNEKTKKEVVCQVVKSKNYRTVTGYVELEFTEPAASFWGMRFPAERVTSAPALSTAPVAHAPAQRPVAPVPPTAAAPPKGIATPPVPAAMKPAAPSPVPVKTVATAPPAALPTVAKPTPAKPAPPPESHAASQIAPPQATPVVPTAPGAPAQSLAPASPVSAKPDPVPVAPAASPFASIETKSAAPENAQPEAPIPSANPTTEELKQQAARLQEQLSSLLFTDTPPAKQSVPEPAKTPIPEIIPTETVQKILQLAKPDVKPPSPPATPVQESKPAPIAPKSLPVSMAVEEVKVPAWLTPAVRDTEVRTPEPVNVPAWLAPLARETDSSRTEAAAEKTAASEANSSPEPKHLEARIPDGDTTSAPMQPTMFGGQLLGTSSEVTEASGSGGSKKGLFIGLAAAGILLIGGGAWYASQPGSALSALFSSKPAASQTQTIQNSPAAASPPAFRTENASPSGPSGSSSQPAAAKPITPAPVPAANSAVNSTAIPAIVKETTSALRNTPAVEEPKKPVLGDVHLATPNVSRTETSNEGSVSAPSIDADQTSSGEPSFSLAGSHSKEPEAPLPIGGDVKSAKLLKSVPPLYPPAARTQRIAGDVKIDALVDVNGNVSSMKVLSGPTLLHHAAMEAVKQWKYEPGKLDGNATPMHLTVTVQFRLQ